MTPLRLVGVSIPRSGHHFLAKLLRHALGDALRYCEFYSEADCCRQVPCNRGGAHRVTYQKNHDFDSSIDPELAGVLYLAQYRDAVPAIVSDRELLAAVSGSELADDPSRYLVLLSERAAQYIRFFDKWIRKPHSQVIGIKYERLLAEPAVLLRELFDACGLAVANDLIERAVAATAPVRHLPPILKESDERAFTARIASESRYFDADMLAVYESLIVDRIPELAATRTFPRVDYESHLLFAMFRIQCARLEKRYDDVIAIAEEARAQWPESYFSFVAGDTLRELGRHDLARPFLENAVAVAPNDVESLGACAQVHLALGNNERAAELAARLADSAATNANPRLFLATILLLTGRSRNALHEALRALELGIAEPHLWSAFDHVVREARKDGWRLQITPAE